MLKKDNHIDFAGGISQAIQKTETISKRQQQRLKLEIRSRTTNY
jgi:nicotinate-nucleotide pyrophosphorylase